MDRKSVPPKAKKPYIAPALTALGSMSVVTRKSGPSFDASPTHENHP